MRLILIEWLPSTRNCRTHVFSVGWMRAKQGRDFVELIPSCYVDGRDYRNTPMRIQRSQIVRQMPLESGDEEVGKW